MKQYTKDEEIELLRKQLAQCTSIMREAADCLRDFGDYFYDVNRLYDGDRCYELANELELARSKKVIL